MLFYDKNINLMVEFRATGDKRNYVVHYYPPVIKIGAEANERMTN